MADDVLSRLGRTGGPGSSRPAGRPAAAPVIGRAGGALDDQVGGAIQAMRGRGAPLPTGVRARMEAGFDSDLSDVRVHTDERAAELSSTIAARAFTVGRDVFFGAGEYRPETAAGEHTLAHELAHTVQDAGGRRAPDSPAVGHEAGAAAGNTEHPHASARSVRRTCTSSAMPKRPRWSSKRNLNQLACIRWLP